MIIDEHNSIELKALNKTIKHLETVLKKRGLSLHGIESGIKNN